MVEGAIADLARIVDLADGVDDEVCRCATRTKGALLEWRNRIGSYAERRAKLRNLGRSGRAA